jgi:predicted SAM-dependent methyltransferase
MQSIKQKIIEHTNRETMPYKLLNRAKFLLRKYYSLLRNGWDRKRKIRQYLENHSSKKVQFGSGGNHLEGFLNTDIFGEIPVDIIKQLPFEDRTFDLVYSSHLIEHIYLKDCKTFLRETYRILKGDGVQVIQAPSLKRTAKIMYCPGSEEEKERILERHQDQHSRLGKSTPANYINNNLHLNYGHRYLYDEELLRHLALEAGYSKLTTVPWEDIPDQTIQDMLYEDKVDAKQGTWKMVTETYLLEK